MSHIKRKLYGGRLRQLLARSNDEEFVRLVWAIDALQSGRESAAAPLLEFPREAATTDIRSPYRVYPWELETLMFQLLVTPKEGAVNGIFRQTLTNVWATVVAAKNNLHALEDAEAALYVPKQVGLLEMHRIGHREFSWQSGYFNKNQVFRNIFIFGQGSSNEYFERTHGLSINDFTMIGFGLHVSFDTADWLKRDLSVHDLGLTQAVLEKALALLCRPIEDMRTEALQLKAQASKPGRWAPVAYQPSPLRNFPLIAFGSRSERLRCPLRELILARITSGIYYDVFAAGQQIRNEANDRFEIYASDYLRALMPAFEISRSYKYTYNRNRVDTPDILLSGYGEVQVVFECKATKLTLGAQFADDPMVEAENGYAQLAKAVTQLWKYFSRVRRGIVTDRTIASNCRAVVLTLDSWLVMARDLREKVLETAATLLLEDAEGSEILQEDRRPIVFCTMEDLEIFASTTTGENFLGVITDAASPEFVGWMLNNIARQSGRQIPDRKPYPFDLAELLPWWERIRQARAVEVVDTQGNADGGH